MTQTKTAPARLPAIATTADGERLIAEIAALMDTLSSIIEEETEILRDGRVAQAVALGARKAELAAQYYTLAERLKANRAFLAAKLPETLDVLRRRHDAFRPVLQLNLTVLATAHAVSEGIIRGVANEVSRKAAPQTYGLSGRPTAPATMRPVTLSRTL